MTLRLATPKGAPRLAAIDAHDVGTSVTFKARAPDTGAFAGRLRGVMAGSTVAGGGAGRHARGRRPHFVGFANASAADWKSVFTI